MDQEIIDEESCGICGEPHSIQACTFVRIKGHIKDQVVPSRARLTLPSALKIERMSDSSNQIAATKHIAKGTQFGPLEAKKLFSLSPEILFPLKLFTQNDYFSEYYLETNDENECNWMMFVPPAQNLSEQNMICFQDDLKIYYVTIKDVDVGESLKVWYSPFYARKMNKNVLVPKEKNEDRTIDLNALLKKQQNLMERDVWTCRFCNIQEKDVTKFASHISQHYSMQVRKACEICKSVFMTRKGLKKHLHIVHGNIPTIEHKESVQSVKGKGEMRDTMVVGDPLLNVVMTDSMDNTNLLLQQTDISRFDMSNSDILLDSDNLNLTMENFMEEDDFNFNIDEDKDQHVCDICLKPFAKLRCLVQHLQKHTGKYTCPECLVIFGRNENLKAHNCNGLKKLSYKCTLCDKDFVLKKYLSRHMSSIHEKKWRCSKCDKINYSKRELKEHSCVNKSDVVKEKYPCVICNKYFTRENYLRKHMQQLHGPAREPRSESDLFICEICAKTFGTNRNLQRHKKIHSQFAYPCNECDKKFSRRDTLSQHVIIEHTSNTYNCSICNKPCKSKRYLKIHMETHSSRKKYKCNVCLREFFHRSNLLKHQQLKHGDDCGRKDTCTHKKTLLECYECPICKKLMKLRSSLLRHLKKCHPNINVEVDNIKKVVRMQHITRKEGDSNEGEVPKEGIGNNLEVRNDQIDFNALKLELNSALSIPNEGICLSMPELTEMDQDVTLSDNAYVLDNGTIVEPLDSENVVVYIIDKK